MAATTTSTTTTTAPTATTTTMTTTSTTAQQPTTTTTVPPEPPASGLYLIDEQFYPTGRVVFPGDLDDPGLFDVPPNVPLGVVFDLPIGAQIRAPFDGCLVWFGDPPPGLWPTVVVLSLDDTIQGGFYGSLAPLVAPAESDGCALDSGDIWSGALPVTAGVVMAAMEGPPDADLHGLGGNLLISFSASQAGLAADIVTLARFFSYAGGSVVSDAPEEDVEAIVELWDGWSEAWSGGVDVVARYIVEHNYPGYPSTVDQCASAYSGVPPGFREVYDVDRSTIRLDDAWTMPLLGDQKPEGRVYLLSGEVTRAEPGADPTTSAFTGHVTVTDDGVFFFINCAVGG